MTRYGPPSPTVFGPHGTHRPRIFNGQRIFDGLNISDEPLDIVELVRSASSFEIHSTRSPPIYELGSYGAVSGGPTSHSVSIDGGIPIDISPAEYSAIHQLILQRQLAQEQVVVPTVGDTGLTAEEFAYRHVGAALDPFVGASRSSGAELIQELAQAAIRELQENYRIPTTGSAVIDSNGNINLELQVTAPYPVSHVSADFQVEHPGTFVTEGTPHGVGDPIQHYWFGDDQLPSEDDTAFITRTTTTGDRIIISEGVSTGQNDIYTVQGASSWSVTLPPVSPFNRVEPPQPAPPAPPPLHVPEDRYKLDLDEV